MSTVSLYVQGCLPGYVPNPIEDAGNAMCDCDTSGNDDIVRCDDSLRYLYLRVCMHVYIN